MNIVETGLGKIRGADMGEYTVYRGSPMRSCPSARCGGGRPSRPHHGRPCAAEDPYVQVFD